jgi:hypothetical protein
MANFAPKSKGDKGNDNTFVNGSNIQYSRGNPPAIAKKPTFGKAGAKQNKHASSLIGLLKAAGK